jgi:hypothetical protein
MDTPQEDKDQDSIRHFKGSVGQFKQMFDDLAGEDTNANNSPAYQGFEVHPTRGETKSPHWEGDEGETQNENRIPSFDLFESKESDELAKQIDKAIIKIDDSMSYKDLALAVSKILKDDYGKHNFKAFMEVLHKDLGI